MKPDEALHNMIHASGALPVERRHDVVSTGINSLGVRTRGPDSHRPCVAKVPYLLLSPVGPSSWRGAVSSRLACASGCVCMGV